MSLLRELQGVIRETDEYLFDAVFIARRPDSLHRVRVHFKTKVFLLGAW